MQVLEKELITFYEYSTVFVGFFLIIFNQIETH